MRRISPILGLVAALSVVAPAAAVRGGPTTPPPITDVKAPKARAFFKSHDGLHHVVSHGLRGTVKSNEAGKAAAVAFISARAAHQLHISKLVKVARGRQTIPSAGSWSIRLKFKKSYRHRLNKANRLVVKVRVVVKDQAGNATVVTHKVILKG
jgi:hypothetical protein